MNNRKTQWNKSHEESRNIRKNDNMKDKFRDVMNFSHQFSEESKRLLRSMQIAVGVRAQVPVKTFSAAVLPALL